MDPIPEQRPLRCGLAQNRPATRKVAAPAGPSREALRPADPHGLWVLILLAWCLPVGLSGAERPVTLPGGMGSLQSSNLTGPTLRLDYHREQSRGNPVATFMYFVPLISPEPVSAVNSADNTQTARVISAQRHSTADSFTVNCEFEITGLGSQQSVFDLDREIHRHEQMLQGGGVLKRQLSSIAVEGACSGQVDVEGIVSNGVQIVTEVRLRFNAHGKVSPVSIGLCDIIRRDDAFQRRNEVVVRVNTLTFSRKPGPPKMGVTVASVRKKGVGSNLWQSIKGGVKGVVANLLIDPLKVEAVGHQAVLDFGQALAAGASTFTFPRAKNLISPAVPEVLGVRVVPVLSTAPR
jgi:hypothetical protein